MLFQLEISIKSSILKVKRFFYCYSTVNNQERQQAIWKLLKLYRPLQSWLINRADVIIGTSPVYLKASPWLRDVQDKTVCLPIGVVPLDVDVAGAESLAPESDHLFHQRIDSIGGIHPAHRIHKRTGGRLVVGDHRQNFQQGLGKIPVSADAKSRFDVIPIRFSCTELTAVGESDKQNAAGRL